jgi:hypothetical protein
MNMQVEYLSDKVLINLSGNGSSHNFSKKLPTTSSIGLQSGSHNIQIILTGVATNHSTVNQTVIVYTAPVTFNYTNKYTLVL